jgi:HK97 gp10 family phage protein
MMRIEITVEGADEVARKLKELPSKLEKKLMRQALKKGAEPILAEAISRVPVRTGNLASQMNVKSSTKGGQPTASIGNGTAYYAIMLEKGSTGPGKRVQKPTPFMAPGISAVKDAIHAVAEELKEHLDEAL